MSKVAPSEGPGQSAANVSSVMDNATDQLTGCHTPALFPHSCSMVKDGASQFANISPLVIPPSLVSPTHKDNSISARSARPIDMPSLVSDSDTSDSEAEASQPDNEALEGVAAPVKLKSAGR